MVKEWVPVNLSSIDTGKLLAREEVSGQWLLFLCFDKDTKPKRYCVLSISLFKLHNNSWGNKNEPLIASFLSTVQCDAWRCPNLIDVSIWNEIKVFFDLLTAGLIKYLIFGFGLLFWWLKWITIWIVFEKRLKRWRWWWRRRRRRNKKKRKRRRRKRRRRGMKRMIILNSKEGKALKKLAL